MIATPVLLALAVLGVSWAASGVALGLLGRALVSAVALAVAGAFADRGWHEPGFLIAVAGPAGGRVR